MKRNFLVLILLAIISFAFCAWLYQLKYGLGVTGMNKPVFWGLYIVSFVFFVGVSAGGIAIASLGHLAGIEKFKPVSKVAEVIAIISILLAMIAITLDLGRPDRLLNLFIYAQASSPIMWDIVVISIYLFLCLAMLYSSIKGKTKLVKILALISIPTFVLLHSVTAWIFGLVKSQPGWHTSILAPLFIVSALVSGLGLIILTLYFSKRFLEAKLDDEIILSLGKYFRILLPVLFYFLFSEILTIAYADIPAQTTILQELLMGKFARIFWFDMFLGIAVPFFIVISKFGKTLKGVCLASLFALVGVFAERVNIVLPSFFYPYLMNEKITYSYNPTWVEYVLIAGLLALGIILFIVAAKIMPLFDGGKK